MRFRKKPVVIEAHQWFKNGDHPDDGTERGGALNGELYEGKVVRYFMHPTLHGDSPCRECRLPMHQHGWIDTVEGGHIVCPGDWVITGVKGERYSCKPDIFTATYDPVDEVDP